MTNPTQLSFLSELYLVQTVLSRSLNQNVKIFSSRSNLKHPEYNQVSAHSPLQMILVCTVYSNRLCAPM